MRLYMDASAIIYSIEGLPEFREATLAWIERAEARGSIVTSRLARLECRVRPLRDRNVELLGRFEGFFARTGLELIEVTSDVIERATELRARHGIRTPDAIHIASAVVATADAFLTGDRDLLRHTDLSVRIVPPSTPPGSNSPKTA